MKPRASSRPRFRVLGPQLIGRQSVQEIFRWAEILDQDFMLISAFHADLEDVEVGSLVRRKEDVIVSGILVLLEQVRCQVATQMVIAPRG
jgi:hypothetical protein